MKKNALLVSFLFYHTALFSFQLKIETHFGSDSVWISGPIQLNLTIKNKTNKTKKICNPKNSNQVYAYIRLEQDSTWMQLSPLVEDHCLIVSDFPIPFLLKKTESTDFRFFFYLHSKTILLPNKNYQLRVIFANDIKNGCTTAHNFSVDKIKKSKNNLYQDLPFKTWSIDSSMINSLDWISKNGMIDAFTSECFYIYAKKEEKLKLKYYLEHFPVSPFYEWAAFQQFKIISESDENEKKYVKEWSKDDLDTLTKYAAILAKSHNLRFKEIGLGWLNVIEKW